MFVCPHPHMTHSCNKLFTSVLTWLQDVDTDPLIIHIIQCSWYKDVPELGEDCPLVYRQVYQDMQEIGTHHMWMGLLHIQLVPLQHSYYQSIGSKKTGQTWGRTFIGKMLRASHQLWMERNHMLHCRTVSGINGLEMARLTTEVTKQFDLGVNGMAISDFYLLDRDKNSILQDQVDAIRGWLCDVLIARGDFGPARLECLRDSPEFSHLVPPLTPAQRRFYEDWRNVRLSQRSSLG